MAELICAGTTLVLAPTAQRDEKIEDEISSDERTDEQLGWETRRRLRACGGCTVSCVVTYGNVRVNINLQTSNSRRIPISTFPRRFIIDVTGLGVRW